MRLIKSLLGLIFLLFGAGLCYSTYVLYQRSEGNAVIFGGTLAAVLFLGGLLLLRAKRKRGSWRNDPATDKQREFAAELGIKHPKKITKGELSNLIDVAKGKRR